MGKHLGLGKGGPYSGMVRFVRRSDTGLHCNVFQNISNNVWLRQRCLNTILGNFPIPVDHASLKNNLIYQYQLNNFTA